MSDGDSEGETDATGDRHDSGGHARLLPVGIVVLIGLATTLYLYEIAKEREQEADRRELENLANISRDFIELRVASAIEVVRGLAGLYAASDDVTREEFLIYTSSVAADHHEISTLEWIEHISADQRTEAEAQLRGNTALNVGISELDAEGRSVAAPDRDTYYPTIYLYEHNNDTAGKLSGFDNYSHPEAKRILEQSAVSNTIVTSTWVSRQFPDLRDGSAISVLVALPVYDLDSDEPIPASAEARLAATRGWVMASLRVNKLLDTDGNAELDHYLYSNESLDESGTPRLLRSEYFGLKLEQEHEPLEPGGARGGNAPARPTVAEKFASLNATGFKYEIEVDGSQGWNLILVPASTAGAGAPAGAPSLTKWIVLIGGTALTILLGAYLFLILGRTREVSNTVQRRTTELRREIAERERAERTLKNSEALYHSLVESAPMCIFRKDLKGRFVFGNSSYAQTIGRSKSSLVGLTDHDLFPKELADKYRADDEKMIASGEFLEDVEEHKTPDGRSLFVHIIKAPVVDAFGNTVGSQGMFWDVTERHEAEERLRATADELARSNADLEQFAYVASHDLQEPLRMVASYTQLLQRRYGDKLGDEANEFIDYAVDGAVRMQHLIEDLLEYSRVETRGKPLVNVDASEALDDALANLKVALGESGATVTRDDLPPVMADQVQLTQVFQNLIANGIKFHRPGVEPEVHVGAKRVSDGLRPMVEFTVRDNGIGIQEDFFDRIFVIFQRLHTREAFPGTGIGLALCKKIVERHGGRIWVKSTVDSGTTFFFTLRAAPHQPLEPNAGAGTGRKRDQAPEPGAATGTGHA